METADFKMPLLNSSAPTNNYMIIAIVIAVVVLLVILYFILRRPESNEEELNYVRELMRRDAIFKQQYMQRQRYPSTEDIATPIYEQNENLVGNTEEANQGIVQSNSPESRSLEGSDRIEQSTQGAQENQ